MWLSIIREEWCNYHKNNLTAKYKQRVIIWLIAFSFLVWLPIVTRPMVFLQLTPSRCLTSIFVIWITIFFKAQRQLSRCRLELSFEHKKRLSSIDNLGFGPKVDVLFVLKGNGGEKEKSCRINLHFSAKCLWRAEIIKKRLPTWEGEDTWKVLNDRGRQWQDCLF